jgi:hypothetical protein
VKVSAEMVKAWRELHGGLMDEATTQHPNKVARDAVMTRAASMFSALIDAAEDGDEEPGVPFRGRLRWRVAPNGRFMLVADQLADTDPVDPCWVAELEVAARKVGAVGVAVFAGAVEFEDYADLTPKAEQVMLEQVECSPGQVFLAELDREIREVAREAAPHKFGGNAAPSTDVPHA